MRSPPFISLAIVAALILAPTAQAAGITADAIHAPPVLAAFGLGGFGNVWDSFWGYRDKVKNEPEAAADDALQFVYRSCVWVPILQGVCPKPGTASPETPVGNGFEPAPGPPIFGPPPPPPTFQDAVSDYTDSVADVADGIGQANGDFFGEVLNIPLKLNNPTPTPDDGGTGNTGDDGGTTDAPDPGTGDGDAPTGGPTGDDTGTNPLAELGTIPDGPCFGGGTVEDFLKNLPGRLAAVVYCLMAGAILAAGAVVAGAVRNAGLAVALAIQAALGIVEMTFDGLAMMAHQTALLVTSLVAVVYRTIDAAIAAILISAGPQLGVIAPLAVALTYLGVGFTLALFAYGLYQAARALIFVLVTRF